MAIKATILPLKFFLPLIVTYFPIFSVNANLESSFLSFFNKKVLHFLRCRLTPFTVFRIVSQPRGIINPFFSMVYPVTRSEEHTSELQSRENLVCRLLLEKNKNTDAVIYA